MVLSASRFHHAHYRDALMCNSRTLLHYFTPAGSISLVAGGRCLSRFIWILFAMAALLVAYLVWNGLYRIDSLSGDGVIFDRGTWSYPRYVIVFPSFPVKAETNVEMRVKGLPNVAMTFSLEVVNLDKSAEFPKHHLDGDWVFEVVIRDDKGVDTHYSKAPFSEWRNAIAPDSSSFWHLSLCDMHFESEREYLIIIRITGVRLTSDMVLEPRLSGGGNELP